MTSAASESIETLSLFNEKATDLENSSFLEAWKTHGSGSFDLLPGPFGAIRKPGGVAIGAYATGS
jgi:hypothetical protein